MVKEVKVKGLEITVPKGSSAFQCETPAMMPKMPLLAAVVSKRGTGKGVLTTNFLEQLKVVDRLFIVSPSAKSNKALLDRLSDMISPEDIYSDVNDVSLIDDIIAKIEQERDDLEGYRDKLRKYRAAMAKIHSEKTPLFTIPEEELLQFHEGPPKHRWNGRVPCLMVWFDDIMGSQLMLGRGARKISHLCIYHRHLGQFKTGGAVGCSLIFNLQAYKSAQGGMPKALRNNLTLLFLGRTKSEKELEEVADEVGGEVSREVFYRLYEQATAEPFRMLMIDFHPKPNHPSMFRAGLSTFLIPE